jgi:hypothetical protein
MTDIFIDEIGKKRINQRITFTDKYSCKLLKEMLYTCITIHQGTFKCRTHIKLYEQYCNTGNPFINTPVN